MSDSLYTGFSNYQEINKEVRLKVFETECDGWGNEKDNFKVYRSEWNKAAIRDYTPNKPLAVDIELSDACNLKCTFCAHGIGSIKRVGFMGNNMVKKIIDECAAIGVYSIKFNWRGEPSINPFLPEAISYAKNRGILEVAMNTNGLPKDEDMFIKCVDSGIDRIIFSVDGHSEQTYKSVRVGGDYSILIYNINRLIEYKKNNNLIKPFIRVQMVRSKINEHEVEDYLSYWGTNVDDVRISDVMNRGQGDKLSVGDQITIGRTRCPQPFQRLIIARNGMISPCCGDWGQDFVVGDISDSSILDVWNGDKLNNFRKMQNDVNLDNIEPCKDCYVKESYLWEKKN